MFCFHIVYLLFIWLNFFNKIKYKHVIKFKQFIYFFIASPQVFLNYFFMYVYKPATFITLLCKHVSMQFSKILPLYSRS